MATIKTKGNCYVCGKTLGKTAMKNHVLKEHAADGDEDCLLLMIEGAYAREYWLLADVAKGKPLSSLDSFLREIWLECCGHLSAFRAGNYGEEIGQSRKLGDFSMGDKFIHEYDMGTTTTCLITVAGQTRRPKQKHAVRLLARNLAPEFKCVSCGEPAEFICQECMYDSENPNFCQKCADEHENEHECRLPITNSPRNGECGYSGEMDRF